MKSSTEEGGLVTESVSSQSKSNQACLSPISSWPSQAWRDKADLRLDLGHQRGSQEAPAGAKGYLAASDLKLRPIR